MEGFQAEINNNNKYIIISFFIVGNSVRKSLILNSLYDIQLFNQQQYVAHLTARKQLNKSKAAGVGTQMYCSFQWSGERYQNLVSNVRAAGNGEGLFIGVKKRALNMDVSLEEREMKRWWAFASKH